MYLRTTVLCVMTTMSIAGSGNAWGTINDPPGWYPKNAQALAPHKLSSGARSRTVAVGAFAQEVPEYAAAASPTVAGLIAELEQSDLIVHIVTGPLPEGVNGWVQIATATRDVRYVRVVLKIPNAKSRLARVLAHELWHAVEIAGMPHVRDGESLAAAYTLCGCAGRRGGFFETDAAAAAGKLAAREMAWRR